MPISTPGILISRDGSVREYVGHSDRTGTLYGVISKRAVGVWQAVCSGCGRKSSGTFRNPVANELRDHWLTADSQMAATHQRKPEATS